MSEQNIWKLTDVRLPGTDGARLDLPEVFIPRGKTAIVGYSGAGKTSLLNLLVGFENPASGQITSTLDTKSERLPLFWVPADFGLWPHLTVEEHLLTVIPPSDSSRAHCEHILNGFDLSPLATTRPDTLSAGERSRLSVARAVASQASVLVMDEPLSHIDTARVGDYWTFLRNELATQDSSLVIASHVPEIILRETEHAICLHAGQVTYSGSVQTLYEKPANPELASLLGPANWLDNGQSEKWLGEAIDESNCIRPERLQVEPFDDSPLLVNSAAFLGAYAELDVTDERDQSRRTFWSRPNHAAVKPGDRIRMSLIGLMLMMVGLLTGCEPETGPELSFTKVTHKSMPPDGARIPAPRSMTVGPNDDLYILDDAGRVLVFSKEGEQLREWHMPEYDVGKPEGIHILQDGRIAVADTHYHRVVLFDQQGEVVDQWGQLGTDPGQFIYPVAVVQDADEDLYVCEYGDNDRVQKFDRNGKFILEFGQPGTEPGQFQRPSGIVWTEGKVYISDAFNNRIQIFSDEGEFIGFFAENQVESELRYPYDISISTSGDLYTVEYGAGRVSRFDANGKLIGRFGQPGSGRNQLETPWGLAVDSQARVYIADTGNRRIVELIP